MQPGYRPFSMSSSMCKSQQMVTWKSTLIALNTIFVSVYMIYYEPVFDKILLPSRPQTINPKLKTSSTYSVFSLSVSSQESLTKEREYCQTSPLPFLLLILDFQIEK